MSAAGVSVVVSVAAFAVSVSALYISSRRDKRDLFLRLHERLASVDQQRGRAFLYQMREQGKAVTDLTDEQREAMNHSLSMINVASLYYVRRYISRRDWLQQWGLTIVRAVDAAKPYLDYRDAQRGTPTWPELYQFAADAREYLVKHGRESELTQSAASDQLPASAD